MIAIKLLGVFLILTLTCVVFSQGECNDVGIKNLYIEKNSPSVHLTFEKIGERVPETEGESTQGIWLRLHNNTKCAIIIQTFVRNFNNEKDNNLSNDKLGLLYEIESDLSFYYQNDGFGLTVKDKIGNPQGIVRKEILIPMYRWNRKVESKVIDAGGSFIFSLPTNHLEKGFRIFTDFKYEWEKNVFEPQHKVYFSYKELPDKIKALVKK